jgi:hypothetical protein
MTGGETAELAFPCDGEMAQRMRGYPWASSPVGEPQDWPAILRTAFRICLTSRFPMIVTYWTYSYSPLHDDDGAVRGVFTAR